MCDAKSNGTICELLFCDLVGNYDVDPRRYSIPKVSRVRPGFETILNARMNSALRWPDRIFREILEFVTQAHLYGMECEPVRPVSIAPDSRILQKRLDIT